MRGINIVLFSLALTLYIITPALANGSGSEQCKDIAGIWNFTFIEYAKSQPEESAAITAKLFQAQWKTNISPDCQMAHESKEKQAITVSELSYHSQQKEGFLNIAFPRKRPLQCPFEIKPDGRVIGVCLDVKTTWSGRYTGTRLIEPDR